MGMMLESASSRGRQGQHRSTPLPPMLSSSSAAVWHCMYSRHCSGLSACQCWSHYPLLVLPTHIHPHTPHPLADIYARTRLVSLMRLPVSAECTLSQPQVFFSNFCAAALMLTAGLPSCSTLQGAAWICFCQRTLSRNLGAVAGNNFWVSCQNSFKAVAVSATGFWRSLPSAFVSMSMWLPSFSSFSSG